MKCARIWIDLKSIMLNKVRRKGKSQDDFPHMYYIKKCRGKINAQRQAGIKNIFSRKFNTVRERGIMVGETDTLVEGSVLE